MADQFDEELNAIMARIAELREQATSVEENEKLNALTASTAKLQERRKQFKENPPAGGHEVEIALSFLAMVFGFVWLIVCVILALTSR